MTISGYKRITIALAVVSVLLAALCVKLLLLVVHTELAMEQIEILGQMRDRALQSDVPEALDCLRYAAGYYPSGTKQAAGSRLDRIVERERGKAVRAIIAHLRSKTGEDFGDDPEKWLEGYRKKWLEGDGKK